MRVQQLGCDRILFGVSSDVTERRRMEQIDVEMRALAELDRLRTELISNVSHELRTPLGLIKAASTTLQRNDVTFPPATQQKILQGITDEADRLEQLVGNLLDIARFDQQRFALNLERVDLTALIASIVEAAARKLASEPAPVHRFVTHLPTRSAPAIVDGARIEQVLRNLLENAIRYSPEGGIIAVTLQANSHACEIRVTDPGIGIAPEEQGRIFERFYRSNDPHVRHIHGTGLGLAICREIVHAHHGTLTVASTLGEGSTFTIHLPRSSAHAASASACDVPHVIEET
jgi:two-component system phosphate regulon sensor histidine kinase PhoR